MINDGWALRQPGALEAAVTSGLPICLMHMLGEPATMQREPRYVDVVAEVQAFLAERVQICEAVGIPRERILVDPGFGFGKTLEHNRDLLAGLSILHGLGTPILLGASRKSSIGKLAGVTVPTERMPGSIAAALAGAMQGATILRVLDVAATRQALAVWEAACRGEVIGKGS
jgi:dihydropteroate synthase